MSAARRCLIALLLSYAAGCELRPPPGQLDAEGICGGMFVAIDGEETLAQATECDVVTGALLIFNAQVDSLDGLEGLQVVGRDVVISFNKRIRDLGSLSSLHTIGGALIIIDNPGLRSLSGLDGLEHVNSVDSISSATISRSFAYEGHGGLGIVGNDNLEELTGLESLKTIGGDLWVVDNPSLESIDAIGMGVEITGDEVIKQNSELRSTR